MHHREAVLVVHQLLAAEPVEQVAPVRLLQDPGQGGAARGPGLPAVRSPQVQTAACMGLELEVIAAVVVGGTAVSGGRGSLVGTLLGVALLGTIGPALTFLRVSAFWEEALQGAIILAAVAGEGLRRVPAPLRVRRAVAS